jgi:hypothetical protein
MMMKKQSILWSMTMMLLFGAFSFTSCGSDDDEDVSPVTPVTPATTENTVPSGFYEIQYNDKGAVDYIVDQYIQGAIDRGNYAYIADGNYITQIQRNDPNIPFGIYVYQSKYAIEIFACVTATRTDNTYYKRTISYPGGETTCYYEFTTLDYNLHILSSKDVTYKDGILTINGSTYKRLSGVKAPEWVTDACKELAK